MFTIHQFYRVSIGCHKGGDNLDSHIFNMVRTDPYKDVYFDNDSIGCWGWHWMLECQDRAVLEAMVNEIIKVAGEMGVVITPEIG